MNQSFESFESFDQERTLRKIARKRLKNKQLHDYDLWTLDINVPDYSDLSQNIRKLLRKKNEI